MTRSLSQRESEALLNQWYAKPELEALAKLDFNIVLRDIYSTAETIFRRRKDEEAESALATLKITRGIAEHERAPEAITDLLRVVLEVLADDRSRENFKQELTQLLHMRGMAE